MTHDPHEMTGREFWYTVVAVFITGVLCFAGAALWDNLNGGPDARQASIDSNTAVQAIKATQERSECVTTYTVADEASDAMLGIAFGNLTQSIQPDGTLSQESLDEVDAAIRNRLHYLRLRLRTNEFCVPTQPGGSQPLESDDFPEIPGG